MNEQKRLDILVESLKLDNDCGLVTTIIEHIGNVQVQDIDKRGNEYEIFMKPSSFTQRELSNLQNLFAVKELGVYGDPDLPGESVSLHLIVKIE